jgi:hypothetical protein
MKEVDSNHDLKYEKTEEQLISLLDDLTDLANNAAYSKRIGFMRDILNAPNKKEILFSNVFTEERINKRYRKLASYFHPDKTSRLNIPHELREEYITLGTQLFEVTLEFKKSLFEIEESSKNDYFTQTSRQTLHEEKANELWKIAIDYRNAHKAQWDKLKYLKKDLREITSEELKRYSTDYGLKAYEEYRAACKLADNNKQLKSQIKLRGYMALSLYICDKFMEAQLYALTAINLVIRNSTNATHQDLYSAKQIYDKVKSGNPCRSENTQLNTEEKTEKDRYLANKEEILQSKRNARSYQMRGMAIMSLGVTHGAALTWTGYAAAAVSGALTASLFVPAGVGAIIIGLYSGYRQIKQGTQLLEEPKTRETLNEIMKQALLAYDKGDHQQFFEELSKEYKSGSRLIKLMRRGDSIHHEDIVNTLIEHGFRPDGIAYLLILISEVLISGKIKIQGITTVELKTQGYFVLNGALSERLEYEAIKLDDRIQKLRKKSWKSPTFILRIYKSLFMDSSIAQESKDDAEKMPIVSRLEEMRNIARINFIIRDILNNSPEEIERAKKVIVEVRESINSHRQYIGMVQICLEALEDLFWVVSGESANFKIDLAIDY